MEELKIFDDERKAIGVASRNEVHKKGYWHETFHCWFMKNIDGMDYIYFQKRCSVKEDFPNLLDITAAGHLLSHESVSDGIREVKEEIGVDVHMEQLISLGIMENCIVTDNFNDKEFSHVYLYQMKDSDHFQLQEEEVSGIFKGEFQAFFDLCMGKVAEIQVEGFEVGENGKEVWEKRVVDLGAFVPHQQAYLENVVRSMAEHLLEINR